jgi:predicted enzyme related to lactoylglutathione lyase
VRIVSLERVLVAVADFERACDNWRKAGFALAVDASASSGIRTARFGAGAVMVELCATDGSDGAVDPIAAQISAAIGRGGGIFGWLWGVNDSHGEKFAERSRSQELLKGIFTGAVKKSAAAGGPSGGRKLKPNSNSVVYLEHMVVMVPQLDEAIVAFERVGLPCKRVREAGRGMRQAFFKLEDSVFEVVGPAGDEPRCWGLAFMCDDVSQAVAVARRNGLEATEPKAAVQGGRIARIVAPLDGVAVAFMDKR